jgi:hypothetical protein
MPKTSPSKPDVVVENHGTIMLFVVRTTAAHLWVAENVEDAHWFGNALGCEPRYAADLVRGMTGAGLRVE